MNEARLVVVVVGFGILTESEMRSRNVEVEKFSRPINPCCGHW